MNVRDPKTTVVVAVSAAVSAIVAAIVVSIGVVGMVLINNDGSNGGTETVTAYPAGYSEKSSAAQAPAPSAVPGAPAPGAPAGIGGLPPGVAPPAAADIGQGAPAVAAPIPVPAAIPPGVVAPAPAVAAPAPAPAQAAPAAAKPTALSPEQLTAKMQILMNGSPDQKANELEAGSAAFSTLDSVMVALKNAGPVMKWGVVGPVKLDGQTLTANIERTVPGWAPFSDPLTWKWIGGMWKLSNAGVCTLASIAFAPCGVA